MTIRKKKREVIVPLQACLSVDSLVEARADVNIGTPAPSPDCKTGTLAQKQEVNRFR